VYLIIVYVGYYAYVGCPYTFESEAMYDLGLKPLGGDAAEVFRQKGMWFNVLCSPDAHTSIERREPSLPAFHISGCNMNSEA
jgi:hypothetical protein